MTKKPAMVPFAIYALCDVDEDDITEIMKTYDSSCGSWPRMDDSIRNISSSSLAVTIAALDNEDM